MTATPGPTSGRRARVDARLHATTTVLGLTVDDVDVQPIDGYPGDAVVALGGLRTNVRLMGSIVDLRAIAVEVDRQLAHLEVEHRITDAIEGGQA